MKYTIERRCHDNELRVFHLTEILDPEEGDETLGYHINKDAIYGDHILAKEPDETPDIITAILKVKGVKFVEVDGYKLDINKGMAFSWRKIISSIIAILKTVDGKMTKVKAPKAKLSVISVPGEYYTETNSEDDDDVED